MKPCEKLKKFRFSRLMTQIQLAQMLGVTHATYNRWERGQSIPSFINRKKLLNFFGKDVWSDEN